MATSFICNLCRTQLPQRFSGVGNSALWAVNDIMHITAMSAWGKEKISAGSGFLGDVHSTVTKSWVIILFSNCVDRSIIGMGGDYCIFVFHITADLFGLFILFVLFMLWVCPAFWWRNTNIYLLFILFIYRPKSPLLASDRALRPVWPLRCAVYKINLCCINIFSYHFPLFSVIIVSIIWMKTIIITVSYQ